MTDRAEFIASLKLSPPRTLLDAIAARGKGYKAIPVTNHIQFMQEGGELEIMGYELRGPRGNRKLITKDEDGLVSMSSVELWLDMIDYSSAKIAEAKRRPRRKAA
jgi:hypothetical protein